METSLPPDVLRLLADAREARKAALTALLRGLFHPRQLRVWWSTTSNSSSCGGPA